MTDNFKKWNSLAKSWSSPGAGIPAANREDLIKSKYKSEDAKRNVGSFLEDPLAINYAMGYKDRKFSLSFDVAKQVVQNLSIVAGILQTRTNQVGSFATPYRLSKSVGYVIKHNNPARLTTKGERDMIQSLEKFIYNCGSSKPNKYDPHRQRDDFEGFLKKIVRDSLMYDQFAAEVVPDLAGKPYEFLAIDAATIRLAGKPDTIRDWMGQEDRRAGKGSLATQIEPTGLTYPYRTMRIDTGHNVKDPAYMQIIHGQPTRIYSADELMFGIRNPRTDIYIQGYGYSEVEQLVSIITSHLYAEEYNRQFFRQGSAPKGLLVFRGDSMDGTQLEAFKRQWKANLEGVSNSWRTPIMQSEQGVDWVNLNQSNKDMEYGQWMEYLIKVTCFPENTFVTLADGVSRPISTIKPGEYVRTLEGGPCKVTNLQTSSFTGDLVTVTAAGSSPFSATANHPIFALTHNKLLEGGEPVEVPANKLTTDHYLMVPKPRFASEDKETTFDLSVYGENKLFFETAEETGVFTGRERYYKYLKLDREMAYFMGVYAASGAHSPKLREVRLTCRSKAQKDRLSQFVAEVFGTKSTASSTGIKFRCLHVWRFLTEEMRACRRSRHFPTILLCAPKDVKVGFLEGFLDTCATTEGSESSGTSVVIPKLSLSLLSQMRALLLSLNIYADLQRMPTERPVHKLTISALHVQRLLDIVDQGLFHKKLEIEVAINGIGHQEVYENQDAFFIPVVNTSTEQVEDLSVYNIEVDKSHTYCVNDVAVHNCSVFLIDPAELNFDLHGGVSQTPLFESSQEWKLKASRDRGLKPLLRFLAKHINNSIISKIDENFVFDFVGLDELTEQEKHTLRTEQVNSYMTLNEIRRAEDLPDLEHGNVPMNPTYAQVAQMAAQAQAAQPQAAGGAAQPAQSGNAVPEGEESEEVPNYSGNFTKSIRSQAEAPTFSSDYDEWEAFAGIEDDD